MKLLPDSSKFFEVDGVGGCDVVGVMGFFTISLCGLSASVSSSDIITIAFDSLSSLDFVSDSLTAGTSPISEFCSTTGLSDRFFWEVFFFTSD